LEFGGKRGNLGKGEKVRASSPGEKEKKRKGGGKEEKSVGTYNAARFSKRGKDPKRNQF